jgi:hypothetical protein
MHYSPRRRTLCSFMSPRPHTPKLEPLRRAVGESLRRPDSLGAARPGAGVSRPLYAVLRDRLIEMIVRRSSRAVAVRCSSAGDEGVRIRQIVACLCRRHLIVAQSFSSPYPPLTLPSGSVLTSIHFSRARTSTMLLVAWLSTDAVASLD